MIKKREEQLFSGGRCLKAYSLKGALFLMIRCDITGDTTLAYGGHLCQAIYSNTLAERVGHWFPGFAIWMKLIQLGRFSKI